MVKEYISSFNCFFKLSVVRNLQVMEFMDFDGFNRFGKGDKNYAYVHLDINLK